MKRSGAARGLRRAGSYAFSQTRRATQAEGAGVSGLSRVIELHAFNAAGDAAVAVSLAGTLFFQVPTGEARGQVALFLAMTMLPFTVVAPLLGPFLDRFSHGRRWAIGTTFALRAFLCWILAGAVTTESPVLFAAALGCLVASKGYGIARSAAMPRLLPPGLTLVRANGRISLAGVTGAAVSAPLAALAGMAGSSWSLRYAFLIFVIGTVLAILLPAQVDSSRGEGTLTLQDETGRDGVAGGQRAGHPDDGRRRRHSRFARFPIPSTVSYALWACAGPRWLSGFLTMFMAFLLRENPIPGWRAEMLLALVIGAAGVGNSLGIALASLLKRVNPRFTVTLALTADAAVTTLAAVLYNVVTLTLVGLTAGIALSLAKLSLDSTIQQDIPERVRTSALARSDTLLQFAWVVGGFIGIALPLNPHLGLGVAAVLLSGWLIQVLVLRRPGEP